jgi:hypothetical protein
MKVRNILLFAAIFLVAALAYQCTENVSGDENAILSTEKSIVSIPGYDWYPSVKDMYHPDTNIIKQIKQEFDPLRHRFIVFSKPACSCDDKQRLFANGMKVLDTAGIDSSHFELFSVRSNKTNHPYMNLFTLNFIPSMILLVDGIPVYSVIDSVVTNTKDYKIEVEILNALKKN